MRAFRCSVCHQWFPDWQSYRYGGLIYCTEHLTSDGWEQVLNPSNPLKVNRGEDKDAHTLTYTGTLTILDCGVCGTSFAMPDALFKDCQRDHLHPFWCPRGHRLTFIGKTEAQKLTERLQSQRETVEFYRSRAEQAIRSRNALKGQVTKVKNRVAKGICPCCNRSFPQLAAHMETEHPSYVDAE